MSARWFGVGVVEGVVSEGVYSELQTRLLDMICFVCAGGPICARTSLSI